RKSSAAAVRILTRSSQDPGTFVPGSRRILGADHLRALTKSHGNTHLSQEIRMLRSLSSLFSVIRRNKSATRSAAAAKRPKTFRPGLEGLETRLVPSSVPLHVVGNHLADPANNTVVLRGVNIASLEWRPDDYHLMEAVNISLNDWHANLLRLPV